MTAGPPGPAPGGIFSEEWFEALSASLRAAPVAEGAPALLLGVVVNAAPPAGGTVSYLLRLGGDSPPSALPGPVEEADVVIVEDYADARALAAGEVTAAELLEAGRIKLRGDVGRLVRAADLLAAIGAGLGRPEPGRAGDDGP